MEKDKSISKIYEGKLSASGIKFGIVVSRFNEFITSKLLDGALDCLNRHGADDSSIDIIRVPGSFEIPPAVKKLAQSKKYHSIIAIGAIIRGDTPHFDYLCAEVYKGLAHISLETGIPIPAGIITADTIEQAIERAGTKAGNKGWDSALNAIEMANLFKELTPNNNQ